MELLLDSINLDKIRYYQQYHLIDGVTSNPTIIKREKCTHFFEHMRQIRQIIGKESGLHIQVTEPTCELMMQEAEQFIQEIDEYIFIKVPGTLEGFKTMHLLKQKGYFVTATAIYHPFQGLLALNANVDYIAPYYNRMENLGISSQQVIAELSMEIKRYNKETKILAASFKNMNQVMTAIHSGAHTVTLSPELLNDSLNMTIVKEAVSQFDEDWKVVKQLLGGKIDGK